MPEQTDNALRQFKSTVIQIMEKLKSQFHVTYAVIPVWRFGDVSNRKRLYIVAISKSAGAHAAKFKFPNGKCNNKRHAIGLDIAEPDDQVQEKYITHQEPRLTYKWREPHPGKMHQI